MALIYKSLFKKAYCLFSLSMCYQRSVRFCVPRMFLLRWYEMSPRHNKPTSFYKASCWTRYARRPTSLFSNFARRTFLVVKTTMYNKLFQSWNLIYLLCSWKRLSLHNESMQGDLMESHKLSESSNQFSVILQPLKLNIEISQCNDLQ